MASKQRCLSTDELGSRYSAKDQKRDVDLARLSWALAHPARVRILRLLQEGQACLCGELVEQMPLAQSTVSQHLKILKEAGLVQGEECGPKVCYCLDAGALERFKALVAEL